MFGTLKTFAFLENILPSPRNDNLTFIKIALLYKLPNKKVTNLFFQLKLKSYLCIVINRTMAEKNKAQLVESITKILGDKGQISLSGICIEDCGTTYPLLALEYDTDEIGVSASDWFFPLKELTKKELNIVYKKIRA